MPAFFLKANEDKAFWSNVITAIEYTVDVVTTLSGVGNIAKFRYLARLGEAGSLIAKIKLGAGIIEITSGVTNTLLKLTGFEDTKTGKALQEYLFYLELLSLSGELTVAVKNGLQKSAKEVLEHEDDLRKTAKNADEDIEDVIKEIRKVAELDALGTVSGRGRRLGQKISKSGINDLVDFLKKENVAFQVFPEKGAFEITDFFGPDGKNLIMTKTTQAAFVYTNKKAKFCVREGVTIYEFMHEFMHFKHSKKIGLENYHALGGYGTSGELVKERLVFDKMTEFKDFLTKEELKSALRYLNDDIYNIRGIEPVLFNFDINKIPEVRKEIDIKKLFHLK